MTEETKKALKDAPLTNLGCESEFAKFDNRVKATGGSTSISTLSKKNVVATNRLLVTEFNNLSGSEKKKEWAWARNSKEAKDVRAMQKDFLEKIKTTKTIAIMHKEREVKERKNPQKIPTNRNMQKTWWSSYSKLH